MSEVVTLEVANRWEAFADKALAGEQLSRGEARTVLAADDDQLLLLLHAAFRVRRAHFGRKVKLRWVSRRWYVMQIPIPPVSQCRNRHTSRPAVLASSDVSGFWLLHASGRHAISAKGIAIATDPDPR